MPRKIRQLKGDLRTAGFTLMADRGKGRHTMWEHPEAPGLLSGQDGDDAKSDQERDVKAAPCKVQQGQ